MSDLTTEVHEAVARLRIAGTDLSWVEVKSAEGGFPKSVASTVSAFANTSGGLIILGIDEASGFSTVAIDAKRIADALTAACAEAVSPPVRAHVDIVDVEGGPVVAARIPASEIQQRPTFVKSQGLERGSYVRTHDGDRHLTTYEVHAMRAAHGQPKDDTQPVPGASLASLNSVMVSGLVERIRSTRAAVFGDLDDESILAMLGVLTPDRGSVTLAGLLALGSYPQEFLPQLNTTFVSFATTNGESLGDGTRFVDNVTLDGPIPLQIQQAMTAVQRNMKRRALVVGLGREDRWEYPVEAIREVLANALMHRDYSGATHGTQVRVELYPDRLVVSSPGGLHGPIDRQDLLSETVTSSRNATLAKLLEDVLVPGSSRTVCENRGTGLLAVAASLRTAGMEPPTIDVDLMSFSITFSNHTVMDDESIAWLGSLSTGASVNDRQRMALAFARKRGTVSNAEYRTLTGVDSATASRELSGLTPTGLLERVGGGRVSVWAFAGAVPTHAGNSKLTPLPGMETRSSKESPTRLLIAKHLSAGPLSSSELADLLGLTAEGVRKNLRTMERAGVVVATEQLRKSSKNKWMLVTAPGGTTTFGSAGNEDTHG